VLNLAEVAHTMDSTHSVYPVNGHNTQPTDTSLLLKCTLFSLHLLKWLNISISIT